MQAVSTTFKTLQEHLGRYEYMKAKELLLEEYQDHQESEELCYYLAKVQSDLGYYQDAIATVDKLGPDGSEKLLYLKLNCMLAAGAYQSALKLSRRCVHFNKSSARMHCIIASCYQGQGELDFALKHLQLATHYHDKTAKNYQQLAEAYKVNNDFESAIAAYNFAAALDPNNLSIKLGLASLLKKIMYWPDLEKCLAKLSLQLSYIHDDSINVYPLMFLLDNFDLGYDLTSKICHIAKQKCLDTKFKQLDVSNPKPRIAYAAANVSSFGLEQFLKALLQFHDLKRYDIYCYLLGNEKNAIFDDLQESQVVVKNLANLTDKQAAYSIYQDNIDILFDVNTFGFNTRKRVFAYQPAKIQAQFLGYPCPSGADYYQYFFTGPHTVLAEEQTRLKEQVIELPFLATLASLDSNFIPKMSRQELGLPEHKFIFANFWPENFINEVCLQAWVKILQSCDDSILWLQTSSNQYQDILTNGLLQAGLDAQCFVITKQQPILNNWHNQYADAILDTPGCHSNLDNCLHLQLNVPLLTLAGRTPATRQSSSLLLSMNMPELVAHSWSDYVDTAISMYQSPKFYQQIKMQLFKEYQGSYLARPESFTQALEKQIDNIISS